MLRVIGLTGLVVGAALCSLTATAAAEEARLLRRPTVSRDSVAFAYASDLWIVSREGGRARRLTATAGIETDPRFSPDGSQIAFTATVGGNTDLYVIPSAGGTPRRLTYHPGLDLVRGWTRDGKRVIFGSARGVLPTPFTSSYVRLWTVTFDGGPPQMLPMPRAYSGTYSPDGSKFAYEEFSTEFETKEAQLQSAQWRHYRGGRTHPIRVMNLADHSEQLLPWSDSNDSDPLWIGDSIYFVSDRNHTANLFAYRVHGGRLEQLTHHDDYDVMNASAGSGAIVYEQGGYIHLLDASTGRSRRLRIQIDDDFAWTRPQIKSVADMIGSGAVSPDGTQVAFAARGDIFVQPVAGKEAANLTQTPAAHERGPAWSPDGAQLAWLSDASGEYQLILAQLPAKARRVIELPVQGYFTAPVWSPDGRYVLLRDNHLTLWMIELASGRATRIDGDVYDDPKRRIEPAWSVDSGWIAYSKNLPNHLRALFLYSVAEGRTHQITDGFVDAIAPVFDRGGAYLYFLVSTDYGQSVEWLGMSALDRSLTRTAYAAVLSATGMPPQHSSAGTAGGTAKPRVDIEGLSKRIVPLGIAAADYAGLIAGPAGTILYAEYEKRGIDRLFSPKSVSLHRYRLRERKQETLLRGIDEHDVSASGRTLLYRRTEERTWALADAERSLDATDASVDTGGLNMRVEPRAEWAHIFRESWRIQRDHFYEPSMHGADWPAIHDKYAPFVAHVNHRADLNYLLATVGGELTVGHSSVNGPGDVPLDAPSDQRVGVGMLGADYAIDNGRYRITRIYAGDAWNPALQAPLAAPGVGIKEGDYLLAVNGRPALPSREVYAYFVGTAGKPTELSVSSSPHAASARRVTVTPLADEEALRTREDWVERNRRLVEQLSNGRIGYVWLPNTGPHGYQAFNREFYAQLDKDGVVIDVRYNQGGFIADYIVHALTRPPFGYIAMRDGAATRAPIGAIYGPKVMLINESSGSGGDALPYHFKLSNVGPLVGTRTWGGLVGAEEPPVPRVLDGGGMTAPNAGFFDLQGRWVVENVGVAPDIEVENMPSAVIAGRDPQLERAVEEAVKLLRSNPVRQVPRPAPRDSASRSSGE